MTALTEFNTITTEVFGHPLPLVQCITLVARRKMIKNCIPASILGYELYYVTGIYPNCKMGFESSPSRIWS